MNSSAFHELTGKGIRGILPLDLSLSWQEKRHNFTVLLPLCYNGSKGLWLFCMNRGNFGKGRDTHSISIQGLWGTPGLLAPAFLSITSSVI